MRELDVQVSDVVEPDDGRDSLTADVETSYRQENRFEWTKSQEQKMSAETEETMPEPEESQKPSRYKATKLAVLFVVGAVVVFACY
ncbi:MAG: hypothetical protein HQ518_21655, partial [Rhodopirellula sp.]|nr:hypothetical protein [Rhodopirellula sp.]